MKFQVRTSARAPLNSTVRFTRKVIVADMWPFKKKPKHAEPFPPGPISFTQLDITETFSDNRRLSAEEWVSTVPLNERVADPKSQGLPTRGSDPEAVYATADRLSKIRESIPIEGDGVYCPTCHIANTSLARLRTPCPKCGKPLLKFGWD
jgi:hypothetical protein